MTAGLAAATFADLVLAALDGTAATVTASHIAAHNGDPGAAGTANPATGVPTTRQAITWGAASGTTSRQRAISNSPSWTATGTDTVSHLSAWSALTSGSFRFSLALTTPKSVTATDILNITQLTFSFTPIAA